MSRTDTEQDTGRHHRELAAPVAPVAAPRPHTGRRGSRILAAAVAAAIAVAAVVLGVIAIDAGDPPAAPQPAPTPDELVAQDFLNAYASFDAAEVATHLADDATMPAEWWYDLQRYEAWGAVFLVEPCETLSTSAAGANITCAFDFHALGTDELGRDPFGLNAFTLRVDDGKVDSFGAVYNVASNGFLQQLDTVGSWVRANHPADWELMASEDVSDADLPRWQQLWETNLAEYENRISQYTQATTAG